MYSIPKSLIGGKRSYKVGRLPAAIKRFEQINIAISSHDRAQIVCHNSKTNGLYQNIFDWMHIRAH